MASKLATDTHFVYLARQVDDDVAERVEELDIPGVLIFDESARLLPAGDMARSLLGSVDLDNDGVAGLELRYDDQLAGRARASTWSSGTSRAGPSPVGAT